MAFRSLRSFFASTPGTAFALSCLVGTAACSSSSAGPSGPSDAATAHDAGHGGDAAPGHDAGPHADASNGVDAKSPPDAPGNTDSGPVLECSGGCTNGLGCAPGCAIVANCTASGNVCSCDCPDAAPGDSGTSCQPDVDAGCPGYYVPASCFDAAIPASPTPAQCAAFCGATNVAACGPTLSGGQPGILCATCLQG